MNIQRGPVCQRSRPFSPFDGIHRSKHQTVSHWREKNEKILKTNIHHFQMFPNKLHQFWTKHIAELYFLVILVWKSMQTETQRAMTKIEKLDQAYFS